jgi:excisionase family DNA binding protein
MTKATTENAYNASLDGACDRLLNKRQLAAKLNVSPRTVDAYMKRGRLCFVKLGKTVRFHWPDVLEKLNAYRVN